MLVTVWSKFVKFEKLKLVVLLVYFILFGCTILFYRHVLKVDKFDSAVFETQDFAKFEKEVIEIGARKSYQLLKERFPGNDPVAHDFAHTIGYVAFYEESDKGISVCDTSFNYGCYHGFMIKFFKKNGVDGIGKMEDACNSLGIASSPSCLHGIGHGLMMESGYNLAKALVNCNVLVDASRPYCWDGVFMERIAGSMQEPADRYRPTEKTLDEPCTSVDMQFKRECWRNQVAVWFNYFGQDGLKVGSRCVVAEVQFRDICFESVGLKLVQAYGENEQKLIEMCKFIDSFAYSRCLIGVMRELMFESKSVDLAQRMCDFVDQSLRSECFSNYSNSLDGREARTKSAI